MFQVIVVLLSCQLFDFNYLSLSNIFKNNNILDFAKKFVILQKFKAPFPTGNMFQNVRKCFKMSEIVSKCQKFIIKYLL